MAKEEEEEGDFTSSSKRERGNIQSQDGWLVRRGWLVGSPPPLSNFMPRHVGAGDPSI